MKNKNAFTLVELLISISIIGILTVIIAVSVASTQKDSRDQRRIGDLKAIQNAAEQYYLLKGSYPVNKTTPWTVNNQITLQNFPTDPKNTNGVGTTYFSTFNINGVSNYCICANVENIKNRNSGSACDFINLTDYFCVQNQQ
jgi:prepilin-type N-terminal cleavage/methylation domain-containing protein